MILQFQQPLKSSVSVLCYLFNISTKFSLLYHERVPTNNLGKFSLTAAKKVVVKSGNFHIRKVKLPYCLTVKKQSFGPHPGKGTPFCHSQSRGNVFETRQYIMMCG